jgi:hypothetical protein
MGTFGARATMTIAAACVLLTTPAHAQRSAKWPATSRTAIAVTGNITIQENRITFANGKRLRIERVGGKEGKWSPIGQSETGTIYRVTPPSDPVLRNRNTLCGSPVTYIVLAYESRHDMTMYVYANSEPPKGDGSDELCASYSYGESLQ